MAGVSFSRRVGRSSIAAVTQSQGVVLLFAASMKSLPSLLIPPVRMVFVRQVFFTGIQAMSKVTVIGALVGVAIITQVSNLVGTNTELIGRILVWTVVRELGPLFAAIIVIVRSCTALAAELASMKINEEITYLRAQGISPTAYLIMPRITGMALSLLVLAFYFQAVAIFGGLALSSFLIQLPFLARMEGIFAALSVFDVVTSLLKSLVFGLLIASVSCYYGLRVQSSITEIPQVTTKAVMQSLFMVIIVDSLINILVFL
jgi:phospholipid/cholesterol/gamma-HCH transport system permease protein